MVSTCYLLDTNVISEPLRPKPHANVMRRLTQHSAEIAIASITWHELCYGCDRLVPSKRKQALERYLNQAVKPQIPILAYDAQAAEWFAAERARLAKIGSPPAYADGQIAAVAHRHQLILVTRNLSDFSNFTGLVIETWFDDSET